MSEQNLNINISASGGSAAAAEVAVVNKAFEKTKEVHGDLQTKFAEKFEHVGVHTFGHQLLEMAGLHGSLVRPVLSAMKLGVNSVAEAFGVATGPIGLFVMGLAATAAIAYKVSEAQKKHAEEVEKVAKEMETAIGVSQSLIEKLENYEKVVGHLPARLRDLLAAERDLNGQQRGDMAGFLAEKMRTEEAAKRIDQDELARLQLKRKEAADVIKQGAVGIAGQWNTDAALKYDAAVRKAEGSIKAHAAALAQAKADLESYAKSGKAAGESVKELTDKEEKDKAVREKKVEALKKVADAEQSLFDMSRNLGQQSLQFTGGIWEKKSNAAKIALDKELTTIRNTYTKAKSELDKYHKNDLSLTKATEAAKSAAIKLYNDRRAADLRQMFGLQATMTQDFQNLAMTTFTTVTQGFSNSVAKMLVEGANFGEAMKAVGIQTAELIISKLIETMIVDRVVRMSKALGAAAISELASGAWGAAVGGPPGSAAAIGAQKGINAPLVAQATISASGFSGVLDRPTMFLAGEAGMESVNITPLNASAGQDAKKFGGGTTNVSVNMVVNGVQDPKRLADQVGLAIIKRIRGMGELNFARAV